MTGAGTACPLCAHAAAHGWWGRSDVTHCGRGYGGSDACHRTWSRTSREAHCTICHRHFGGATGFDHHLFGPPSEPAEHRDPVAPGRNPRPYHQDENGVWRQAWHLGGAVSGPPAAPVDSAALAAGATP